jgi:hypothetical protein
MPYEERSNISFPTPHIVHSCHVQVLTKPPVLSVLRQLKYRFRGVSIFLVATGVMPTVHFIPRTPLCHDPLAATADNNADVNVAVVVPLSSLPNTKEIGEVGYKFSKKFGTMGWFTGTVVEIIPNAELGYDRRCVYTEDGDVEDLRLEDLVELAKLDDSQSQKNDCSMNGRQSPAATNHKESSSAKKRKCIKNTSALTKIKSSKYSGISNSQREKIAMKTLASYLVECGGMFQI